MWPLLLTASTLATLFALACCQRSGAADEATDQALGDLPALPKGMLRERGMGHRNHSRMGGDSL